MSKQVNVLFPDEQVARLGRLADRMGLTVSSLVRVAAIEYADEHEGEGAEMDEYTKKGEWGGYTVRKSETGFVVEHWSARQGELMGDKYVLPYGSAQAGRYGKDANLSAPHNEGVTAGDYLYEMATSTEGVRVVRKGHIVH